MQSQCRLQAGCEILPVGGERGGNACFVGAKAGYALNRQDRGEFRSQHSCGSQTDSAAEQACEQ